MSPSTETQSEPSESISDQTDPQQGELVLESAQTHKPAYFTISGPPSVTDSLLLALPSPIKSQCAATALSSPWQQDTASPHCCTQTEGIKSSTTISSQLYAASVVSAPQV